MSAGTTSEGRRRAKARRKQQQRLGLTPLIRAKDHGDPVRVVAADVGEADTSGRWAESFLELNRPALRRVLVHPTIRGVGDGVVVELRPGSSLGAVPLLAPSTRRVTAGLLVEPRFGWSRVGTVLGDVGFSASPQLGGLPMVPGSAREVPPWVLAGPVLMRLAAVIRQLGRSFGVQSGLRASPRGRVSWGEYARHGIPTGRWQRFHCSWPELQRDPWMTSTLRWTIEQIASDLDKEIESPAAGRLRELALHLLQILGFGPRNRPDVGELDRRSARLMGEVARDALQGVAWVAEERGLGGARALDGVAWSLGADVLWEAWVESFVRELALRLGGRVAGHAFARRALRWSGPPSSLTSLEPDVTMLMSDRTVYFDAKYKFHLQNLRWRSWTQQPEATRAAHRADVHQALAYAALSDAPQVDTVLTYPLPNENSQPVFSVAQVPSGRRGVRLVLLGLPFGCTPASRRRETLAAVEGMIRQTAGA